MCRDLVTKFHLYPAIGTRNYITSQLDEAVREEFRNNMIYVDCQKKEFFKKGFDAAREKAAGIIENDDGSEPFTHERLAECIRAMEA